MNEHSTARRTAWAIIIVKVIALAALAALSLRASLLPYDMVKARLDSMAADRMAEEFDAAAFSELVSRLRAFGVALIVVAALIVIFRRPLSRWLEGLFLSLGTLWRDFREACVLSREGRFHVIAFWTVTAAALALRLLFINQPIRYDEAHSFMYYASRPIVVGLSNYASVNNHLFHTLLVHISYSIFGNEEWALRLPALVAGLLLVPATYMAARMLYDKNAAILAASLVAASSALIEFSTNARGYSLICLVFMLLLSLAVYLKNRGGTGGWVLFTVLSAVGFYTIPVMLYPFGIVCVWLFLSAVFKDTRTAPAPFIRNLVLAGLFAAAITLILYTPVFVASGFEAVFGIPSLAAEAAGGWRGFASGIVLRVEAFWAQWNRDFPASVGAILAAGFVISLVLHRSLARHKVPLIIAVLFWVVPVLVIMRALPWPRVWLYLLPLYFIVVSAGLAFLFGVTAMLLRRRPSTICAIMALHVVIGIGASVAYSRSVYYSEETGTLRNAEEIALTFGPELGPRDKLLAFAPAGAPLLYYFKKHDIPTERLVAEDRDRWQKVYVVVDVPTHDLDWVLSRTRLDVDSYREPELVEEYEFAEIYLFERR